jgi:transcriptional regulator with XRE-family HTH domain
MSKTQRTNETNLPTILRRMRESSSITMRQAGGIVGISHVAISQFENGKLSLPQYRIEQLVKAYGFTSDEYRKILGHEPVVSPKDDCYAMLDRLGEEELSALRQMMALLIRPSVQPHATKSKY